MTDRLNEIWDEMDRGVPAMRALDAVIDEINRKADALQAIEQTITHEDAMARVLNADPLLRLRYDIALRAAGEALRASSPNVSEGDEIQSFGPCTRCGAPVTWHNGLFLCADCMAGHFAMPNLALLKVQGATFAPRWADYTFASLGSYTEAKSGEGNALLFKPALAQAIWHFDDGFCYAEIRRLSSEGPAESIQLVNIKETKRKEALRLATRGFNLLDFTWSRRGRPILDKAIEEQQRVDLAV